MPLYIGQSNHQTFVNLITEKGNIEHVDNYVAQLKEVDDYDEKFKLFDAYKRSYKDRLNLFIDEYNGHTNELKFIIKELVKLKEVKLFPFTINWVLEINKEDTRKGCYLLWPFLITEGSSQCMEDEYFDLLVDIFYFLNNQQTQIIHFLNEIKDHIIETTPNIEKSVEEDLIEEEDIDPLKETMVNKIRLLYHLGVLDYLKEKYDGERSTWGKLLDNIIDHGTPESVERSVVDFFNDRFNPGSKNDFRLQYNPDKVEQYISNLLREKGGGK
jgi:hypothetical protein